MANTRATLVETTTIQPGLPDYRDMARAFRGEAGRGPGAHFILTMAAALAEVHRSHRIRPGDPYATAAIRADLASLIDRWIETNLPGRAGWSGPRRSVGALADEMAAAHIEADHRRESGGLIDRSDLHAAHLPLGRLATAWSDLTGDVAAAQPYPADDTANPVGDAAPGEVPQRIPGTHYPFPVTASDPPPLELLIRVAAAFEQWDPEVTTTAADENKLALPAALRELLAPADSSR